MSSIEDFPAMKPPPGTRPNFVNPPSYEQSLIILEGIFLPLMLLAVAVRIFVRARITKAWGWDDYTCVVAAFGSLAHMIAYTQMFKVGFGRHLWDIRVVTLLNSHNVRLLSLNGVLYPFTIFFAKLSILLLYLRIFDVDRILRYAIFFGIVFQALFYTAMIGLAIGSIIKCNGAAKITDQFCVNYSKPVIVLITVINVVTDFYVLVLPIRRVLSLQLSAKLKLGLLLVFAGGIGTCFASLSRLIIFSAHYNDPDILWIQARLALVTIIEINVAIIVACSSCFRPFFTKTKTLSSSVIYSIRSRLVASGSFDSLPKSGSGQDAIDTKQGKGEGWHDPKPILTGDRSLVGQNADGFGPVTTVGAKPGARVAGVV